ncbi:hypothetical protein [Massilia genomosp. 1]|uniref:Uncharacterized protein n=1 Tax=Massilia genomosp. 1 TaxID=2609280 RepID=A0ABX0ML37_9BURK|nr:hypothetical protein [Massilia genomosp. 1]NHZ61315.1 hypothetical protein [Massilia genomosp. 1]
MHASATLLSFSLGLSLFSALIPAHACKLAEETYSLNAFLAKKDPKQVVFLGKVTSVVSLPTPPSLLVAQNFESETTRWWRGTPRKRVSASGYVEEPSGSSCDGAFDFSVEAGAEWLIVGYVEDGRVHPMPMLSKRLTNGGVPNDVLHILDAQQ